jgi:hypothetical protein
MRLLIKNMMENRDSGWEKSKNEDTGGPKKVQELWDEAH